MRKLLPLVIPGSVMTLMTGGALAATNLYSGAECEFRDTASSGTLQMTSLGAAVNTHTTNTLDLICPVKRNGTGTTPPSEAKLIVHDRNPTANKYVDCVLRCADDSSTAESSSASHVTTSSLDGSDGIEDYYAITPATPSQAYNDYGSCFFWCTIPPASSSNYSGISGYQVLNGDGAEGGWTHVYAGVECSQAQNTADPPAFPGSAGVKSIGALQNDHASDDMWVTCPITYYSNGTSGVSDVKMYVADQNSNKSVDCTLKCLDDAAGVSSENPQSTSVGGTSLNSLLDFSSVSSYVDGQCMIYCKVPDKNNSNNLPSYVTNYVVTSP